MLTDLPKKVNKRAASGDAALLLQMLAEYYAIFMLAKPMAITA